LPTQYLVWNPSNLAGRSVLSVNAEQWQFARFGEQMSFAKRRRMNQAADKFGRSDFGTALTESAEQNWRYIPHTRWNPVHTFKCR
jgi:hypothetical protein